MQRIDIHATHQYQGYKIRPGKPYPFGASLVPGGINFSVFSRHADYCVLVIFEKGDKEPLVEIPFRGLFQKVFTEEPVWGEFRVGNVFTMTILELDHEVIEYGFRMDSGFPKAQTGQPAFHRFDSTVVLMDPYARAIGGRDVWGQTPNWDAPFQHRSRVVFDDFDWEGDRALEIPLEDLVVYEMHVRGFTRHSSSELDAVKAGTFSGIREKIPYLKQLGVNCVELMPLFEFDEFEHSRWDEEQNRWAKMNYWGYSTVGFFSPKAGYAATGGMHDGTMVADELKNLVKELHRNGIEVILDVVFNHTAEGNEQGPTISYRGIDNVTYYMLTPEGYYYNFSGTGNTLNCNNPIVRDMVLDALRYWASQYHIDGFRFDLASILGRDTWGAPMANPPLLEALAFDPILGKCKLIAEAWDAGGLYQVGSFPAYGRWAEWNGRYRDTLRRFLKGDAGQTGAMSLAIQGSPDLYQGRGSTASINFVTCHDGFNLADLVSYNDKHNEANGEYNRDGANDNASWNCGWEGPTDDAAILTLRQRQMKNAMAMLLVSQGVPMILMGDELGQSKLGNNNTYCLDNEINWLDWSLQERNEDYLRFVSYMIAFRRAHPVLRSKDHFHNTDYVGSGYSDISWHGTQAWQPDQGGRVLAFMLCGRHAKGGSATDDYIYVAMNMYWEALPFELPRLPTGMRWLGFANTSMPSPEDVFEPGSEPELEDQSGCLVGGRAVVVLVGRSTPESGNPPIVVE
ncbi:MAG: glycogen debranching enzyme [Candidatus Thiodiazotropha sp. (ex Dulcina madagascariensis)]|nr:glycogen debranching enzyme [Candidatus Thiodiazotropha sp. (ex Dulcina madagascariensis)]